MTTGFIGSGKIFITCLKCGNKFRPGGCAQIFGVLNPRKARHQHWYGRARCNCLGWLSLKDHKKQVCWRPKDIYEKRCKIGNHHFEFRYTEKGTPLGHRSEGIVEKIDKRSRQRYINCALKTSLATDRVTFSLSLHA
jgi:hypothetical protein